MKRKLFLLNTFLSTSLVAATVISCTKPVKSIDDTQTTEITIKEQMIIIKQNIRNIIEDYTTNASNKDWVIDFGDINYEKEKINVLKKAVSNMISPSDSKSLS